MQNTGTLKVTAAGDHEILMTRVFDAPRRLVFEAFTKPEPAQTLVRTAWLVADRLRGRSASRRRLAIRASRT